MIKKTKSVKALLNAFKETQTALSASEMVERFRHQMNKSTVYRILERLEDNGILHSFVGKDGLRWYALSDSCSGLHPHFQCQNCGKTECLDISLTIPEILDYNIGSVSLLLIGSCGDCID